MKLLYLFLASCLLGNAYGMNWDKDLPKQFTFQVKKDQVLGLKLFAALSKESSDNINIKSTIFSHPDEFLKVFGSVIPMKDRNNNETILDFVSLEYVLAQKTFEAGRKLGKEEGGRNAFNERYKEGYDKAKKRYFLTGFGTCAVFAGATYIAVYYDKIRKLFN